MWTKTSTPPVTAQLGSAKLSRETKPRAGRGAARRCWAASGHCLQHGPPCPRLSRGPALAVCEGWVTLQAWKGTR